MNKKGIGIIVVAVVVLALLLAFGYSGEKSTRDGVSVGVGGSVDERVPDRPRPERIEVTIEIENGKFTPNVITLNPRDIVRALFRAVDADYDFTMPHPRIPEVFRHDEIQIAKGTEELITIRAEETGRYIFYCKSCGGPDSGPVGYLEVEDREGE